MPLSTSPPCTTCSGRHTRPPKQCYRYGENLFTSKKSSISVFNLLEISALQRMHSGESPEGSFQVIKLLSRRPSQWEQCVTIGRLKFEKYFKRKVK